MALVVVKSSMEQPQIQIVQNAQGQLELATNVANKVVLIGMLETMKNALLNPPPPEPKVVAAPPNMRLNGLRG